MTEYMNREITRGRETLNFECVAREDFSFLKEMGFLETESLPTLIRYRKGDVELDVYHGRKSYEIGAGVSYRGTRYSLAEIVRAIAPETAKHYRNFTTNTQEGVALGLDRLSMLMKRYGLVALSGDPQFFLILEAQRKQWSQEYALDILAKQLRPQADEAFQKGDYAVAAQLYARIEARLSPVEAKKMVLAQRHRFDKGNGGN